MFKDKKKMWILILALVFIVCAGAFIALKLFAGAISVTEADCPDGICVRQGKLTTAGVPIVCMPHRLVIEIYGDAIDG